MNLYRVFIFIVLLCAPVDSGKFADVVRNDVIPMLKITNPNIKQELLDLGALKDKTNATEAVGNDADALSTRFLGLVKGISNTDYAKIVSTVFKLTSTLLVTIGQPISGIVIAVLGVVITKVIEYFQPASKNPLISVVNQYRHRVVANELELAKIHITRIKDILAKSGNKLEEDEYEEIKENMFEAYMAKRPFIRRAEPICFDPAYTEEQTNNVDKDIKGRYKRHRKDLFKPDVELCFAYLQDVISFNTEFDILQILITQKVLGSSEAIQLNAEKYIKNSFRESRILDFRLFKHFYNPIGQPNSEIMFQIFETPGRHQQLREYVLALYKYFKYEDAERNEEDDEEHLNSLEYLENFEKIVVCRSPNLHANCFALNETTGVLPNKEDIKSIFVPYSKVIQKIKFQKGDDKEFFIPGIMAVNSDLEKVTEIVFQAAPTDDKKEEIRAKDYVVACDHEDCCHVFTKTNGDEQIVDKFKHICPSDSTFKNGIKRRKIQSLWIPPKKRVKIHINVDSLRFVGPHFIALDCDLSIFRGFSITSTDLQSEDVIQYCDTPNGGGMCLQAIDRDWQNRQQHFKDVPCPFKIKSFIVPQKKKACAIGSTEIQELPGKAKPISTEFNRKRDRVALTTPQKGGHLDLFSQYNSIYLTEKETSCLSLTKTT